MKTSAVIVSYRRRVHLGEILTAWLENTPDVWLCDCGKEPFRTDLPVHIVHCWPDPGNRVRHAVALMTDGDLVIKADDDIVPGPSFAADMAVAYETYGEAIYGIHGRLFRGPQYYGQTVMIGAGKTERVTPVDFVGVITAAPRSLLPMDLRTCQTEVEDLYWQMEMYPKAKKFVVPTKQIRHLQESFDPGRLCGSSKSRQIRSRYYAELYKRNYASRPK